MQRKKLSVILTGVLVVYSCELFQQDKLRGFIPGTYVRHAVHEFGSEDDTLMISVLDEEAETYKIIRRWSYQRRRDGELMEPDYKVIRTTGYYQAARKRIWENGTGTIYLFDPKKKILMNGHINYQKL